MTNKSYAEIFNHNGASYHHAMQLCPHARDEEFNAALSLLNLKVGDQLLDVPAGGAYLKGYLPESANYYGLEFSAGFDSKFKLQLCSETQLNLETASIDKAICLAAMHHVQDKAGFLKELRRCLKTGGTLLIGDVIENTKQAYFLNGFVDQWNALGHKGDFINVERDTEFLKNAGFVSRHVIKHYHWSFDSQLECQQYIRHLFVLDKHPNDELLIQAISTLGSKKNDSKFYLQWSLGFLVATAT